MTLKIEPEVWIIYHILIGLFIALDLKLGREEFKEALKWLFLWISVAISFGLFILFKFGLEAALLYYTAYTVEYTLSMDNLFVFAVIFIYFSVPLKAQRFVLYAGIVSAIIMRGSFIYGGLLLLEVFEWMVFVFGATLIYLGIKLWKGGTVKIEPEKNPIIILARKFLPITPNYHNSKFIVRQSKRILFTPLILVLLSIEFTDLIFAFDSLPAAIAITRDFFIAYTSNISAILGLRSLYFVISKSMFGFKYISKGLSVILVFLGIKFLMSEFGLKIPTGLSVIFIFGILGITILLSVIKKDQ
ncbi:Inner membrane protein alx [archaeon HR06]|nr:Inner membrane protein alx [archaeon HR06]